ncbi:hypothetical protein HED60_19150 [Planctomycetales bacterium ZRK34]|nr:hypothetical protein HED60_19150 [Planctomycetales bacterium ZRK34]
MHTRGIHTFCLLFLIMLLPAGQAPAAPSLDEIMTMLPDEPTSVIGRSIDDRAAWDPIAKTASGKRAIAAAAKLAEKPIDAFRRDLYMEYFENGNRSHFQSHNGRRWRHLRVLVMGELLENRGRFVPAIKQAVEVMCSDPSWMLPAHDRKHVVVDGKQNYVDLGVAMYGYEMALTRSLLASRLDEATRQLIKDNLQRRIIDPVFDTIRNPEKSPLRRRHWWQQTTNNWNAVCTAGTTGVILSTVDSKRERAEAVASAMDNMTRFLAGFTADGYCSEGLGYWNYGFGHFAVLRQMLLQQTGGKIDLLDDDKARAAAKFPLNIHILDDVWPSFADASPHGKPGSDLMTYLGWQPAPKEADAADTGLMYWTMVALFSPTAGAQHEHVAEHARRTYFDQGGVMIVRPGEQTKQRFAAALKAGHNAEHHNHNDVGSMTVVLDGKALILDPGSMVYTADTFSSKRYTFAIMNSYGHSVPVIDGQLQQPGRAAAAKVVSTEFTDEADTFAIDLTACYKDANLSGAQRTWRYDRRGEGSLTMTDHIQLKVPGTIETALVGVDDWRRGDSGVLYVRDESGAALRVEITCAQPYDLVAEKLENPRHFEPVRVGIRLREPVAEATIKLMIRPAAADEAAAAKPVTITGKRLTITSTH